MSSKVRATLNRRQFNTTVSAGLGMFAIPTLVSSSALADAASVSPNSKIRLGIIGCNGMGAHNLGNCAKHPGIEVRAICDVSKERRETQAAKYPGAKTFNDFREMLDAKLIDACIVASPPHWHCLHAIAVLEAGLDLYLQKPMTLHLAESLAVKNAVKKTGRICQVGTQIHASENYRRVVEKVQAGVLGSVSVARTFNVQNQGPGGIGTGFDGPVPEGVDWQLWLGPGPDRNFNQKLYAGSFEHGSFMAYSGGWTPNMAPHIVDLPVWAMNLQYPTMVSCSGGRYVIKDDGDAPDVQEMTFSYPNATLTWSMSCINSYAFDLGSGTPARRLGIYFMGDKATMWANYAKHEIIGEGDFFDPAIEPDVQIPPSNGHEIEWVDCVYSRKQPSCTPEYHCRVDIPLVLGNLAMKLGRSIRFDPQSLRILDDPAAEAAAIPQYCHGWKFPAQYLDWK